MRNIYDHAVIRWLRDAYWAELPSNYDHTFEVPYIPNRSGNNTSGQWASRLYRDKFILWVEFGGHYLPEEWLLQAHEGVKRLRRDRRGQLDYEWLRYIILWRGLPCSCGHAGPVEHLAAVFRAKPPYVAHRALWAARAVAAVIGIRRDPAAPAQGVALPLDRSRQKMHTTNRSIGRIARRTKARTAIVLGKARNQALAQAGTDGAEA